MDEFRTMVQNFNQSRGGTGGLSIITLTLPQGRERYTQAAGKYLLRKFHPTTHLGDENRGRRQKQILFVLSGVFQSGGDYSQFLSLSLFRKRLTHSDDPVHLVRFRRSKRLLRQSGRLLTGEKNIRRTDGALHERSKKTFISRHLLTAFRTPHFDCSHNDVRYL